MFNVQHAIWIDFFIYFIFSSDYNDNTLLMKAAENGHAKVVELLLNLEGIDVDAKNDDDETALCKLVDITW